VAADRDSRWRFSDTLVPVRGTTKWMRPGSACYGAGNSVTRFGNVCLKFPFLPNGGSYFDVLEDFVRLDDVVDSIEAAADAVSSIVLKNARTRSRAAGPRGNPWQHRPLTPHP
jgi:hypothetical protein